MKKNYLNFLLSSLILVFSFAFVSADHVNIVVGNVPYTMTVGENHPIVIGYNTHSVISVSGNVVVLKITYTAGSTVTGGLYNYTGRVYALNIGKTSDINSVNYLVKSVVYSSDNDNNAQSDITSISSTLGNIGSWQTGTYNDGSATYSVYSNYLNLGRGSKGIFEIVPSGKNSTAIMPMIVNGKKTTFMINNLKSNMNLFVPYGVEDVNDCQIYRENKDAVKSGFLYVSCLGGCGSFNSHVVSGNTVTGYSMTGSNDCTSASRQFYCIDKEWTGSKKVTDYPYLSCEENKNSCQDRRIPSSIIDYVHGTRLTGYSVDSSIDCASGTISKSFVCNDGIWTGEYQTTVYKYASCSSLSPYHKYQCQLSGGNSLRWIGIAANVTGIKSSILTNYYSGDNIYTDNASGYICKLDGSCGSANGVATIGYPTSNRCSTGIKLDVDTGGIAGTYAWRCDGINGGINATCSAPRQYRGYTCQLSGSTLRWEPTGLKSTTISATGNYMVGSGIYTSSPIDGGYKCFRPVNGLCKATHYDCLSGTSASNVSSTSQYTWDCQGLYHGGDVSCKECKAGYTGFSCVSDTCAGSVPANATINATQQTLGNTWSYNTAPGVCTYKCAAGYHTENGGVSCISNTEIAYNVNCTSYPSSSLGINRYRNNVNTITQTRSRNTSRSDWTPTSSSIRSASASNTECRYNCNPGWTGPNCDQAIINGSCGGANGVATIAYPVSNLCSLGTKVDVDNTANDGIYNWRCDGINGGSNAACSANKLIPNCPASTVNSSKIAATGYTSNVMSPSTIFDAGSRSNSSDNKFIFCTGLFTCPAGGSASSFVETCSETCDEGYELVAGVCKPICDTTASACLAGWTPSSYSGATRTTTYGWQCTKGATKVACQNMCASSEYWNGGSCVKGDNACGIDINTCKKGIPSGATGNACGMEWSCYFGDNLSVPSDTCSINCDAGQTWNGSECVAITCEVEGYSKSTLAYGETAYRDDSTECEVNRSSVKCRGSCEEGGGKLIDQTSQLYCSVGCSAVAGFGCCFDTCTGANPVKVDPFGNPYNRSYSSPQMFSGQSYTLKQYDGYAEISYEKIIRDAVGYEEDVVSEGDWVWERDSYTQTVTTQEYGWSDIVRRNAEDVNLNRIDWNASPFFWSMGTYYNSSKGVVSDYYTCNSASDVREMRQVQETGGTAGGGGMTEIEKEFAEENLGGSYSWVKHVCSLKNVTRNVTIPARIVGRAEPTCGSFGGSTCPTSNGCSIAPICKCPSSQYFDTNTKTCADKTFGVKTNASVLSERGCIGRSNVYPSCPSGYNPIANANMDSASPGDCSFWWWKDPKYTLCVKYNYATVKVGSACLKNISFSVCNSTLNCIGLEPYYPFRRDKTIGTVGSDGVCR